MKVIDVLNKIANGELEDLTHIKNIEHDCEFIYHKKDCRFEFVKKGIWEDYFYKFDISELNDEIEILEEQKENKITPDDIKNIGKTFGTIERLFKSGYEEGLEESKEELEEIEFAKAGDLIITIINKLIENQNKIIKKLNKNN